MSATFKIVQVGDHPPESLALWTIRKIAPTATEMLLLAARFHDATRRLELAAQDENFQAATSACTEIDDLSDKIAFLNWGLKHAMRSHEQESRR